MESEGQTIKPARACYFKNFIKSDLKNDGSLTKYTRKPFTSLQIRLAIHILFQRVSKCAIFFHLLCCQVFTREDISIQSATFLEIISIPPLKWLFMGSDLRK